MSLSPLPRVDSSDVGFLRNPAYDAKAVTPANDTVLPSGVCRGIYVGGAGDVTVVTAGGTTVTFKAVPVGTTLAIRAQSINATNTTATLMLALY